MHDAPFRFGEPSNHPIAGGELVLSAGDAIVTTCIYSNPTSKSIAFGESKDDEMCFNFAQYYPKGALRCRGGLTSEREPVVHPKAAHGPTENSN